MRWFVALLSGLSFAQVGCAAVEIDYVPAHPTTQVRDAREPLDVEVYSPSVTPDWDYQVAGFLQEEERDSIPGGTRAIALIMRERAAEEGCDGVILGGNVSSFEGEYVEATRQRRRWNDGSKRVTRWVPVFEHLGTRAQCLVRLTPDPLAVHAYREAEKTPREFYSF